MEIFQLRRDVEGRDGLKLRKKLTGLARDALAVVDEAVAWRERVEREEREREARTKK